MLITALHTSMRCFFAAACLTRLPSDELTTCHRPPARITGYSESTCQFPHSRLGSRHAARRSGTVIDHQWQTICGSLLAHAPHPIGCREWKSLSTRSRSECQSNQVLSHIRAGLPVSLLPPHPSYREL